MWIRSRNNHILMQTNILYVDGASVCADMGDGENSFELGEYENTKRALEVLDEIQRYIDNFENDKVFSKTKFITEWTPMSPIYEMPKE